MEKIRIFEGKCHKICTSMNRPHQSNYCKYISNVRLYNAANITRIDNFIMYLIRKHIITCIQCEDFNLIMAPNYTDTRCVRTTAEKLFVPPEGLLF